MKWYVEEIHYQYGEYMETFTHNADSEEHAKEIVKECEEYDNDYRRTGELTRYRIYSK